MRDYEKIVMEHYNQVAAEDGDSALSAMKDQYVRSKETEAIIDAIQTYTNDLNREDIDILDVGCGNGYTLSEIRKRSDIYKLEGLEKNDSLRAIATDRFKDTEINIYKGDILDNLVEQIGYKDVVISQRVVINLLNRQDQEKAIKNLSNLVKVGGMLIMLECMNSSLAKLNEGRAEFGFSPIKPSFHNLYLEEDMLPDTNDRFERYCVDRIKPENFLSSHYYVGRVLHDIVLSGRPFVRNSHFLDFMTQSIPEGIGDYSPIKFYVFKRKR